MGRRLFVGLLALLSLPAALWDTFLMRGRCCCGAGSQRCDSWVTCVAAWKGW